MAMVGSLAFSQDDDQEDSNFFDQLADDLGSGDLGHLQPSLRQDGNPTFIEGFSKLSIAEQGSAPTPANTDQIAGGDTQPGDEFWLEENLIEGASLDGSGRSPKDALTSLGVDFVSASTTDGSRALQEETPVFDANHLEDHKMTTVSLDQKSLPVEENVSEASSFRFGNPAILSGTEITREDSSLHGIGSTKIVLGDSMGAPHGDLKDPRCKEGELVEGVSNSTPADAHPLMNTVAGLETSAFGLAGEGGNAQAVQYIDSGTDVNSSSGVKEVQWSSFGNTFAPNNFGSYSDFFMDLGDERGASCIEGPGAQIGVDQAQSLLESPLGDQDGLGSETLGQQGSLDHGQVYDTDIWSQHCTNDQASQVVDSFHKLQAIDSRESVPAADVVSKAGRAGYSSNSGTYDALVQDESQQNWVNAYPGWYFDYTTYQWRQIEREGSGTRSGEGENGLSYGEAAPSHTQTMQFGQGVGIGSEWSTLGSDERSQTGVHANHNDQLIANDVVTQEQVNWEEQYPGWYYDHQSQQWCQVPVVDNQSWVSNQGNVGQSWIPNQGNAEGQSWVFNQGKIEEFHAVDPMQVQKVGWTNNEIHQSGANQNIYSPQSSPSVFVGGGDMSTLTRGMSFNTWTEPSVGMLDAGPHGIDNMKEGWKGGNASSWTGFQGGDNITSGQAYQPLTGYSVGENSPFSTNSEGFYQPHNTSVGGIEGVRSSAGRPSHALVAFGFGGKLVTMKAPQFGTSEPLVLNDLNKLVLSTEKGSYFFALNRQGLNGPLVNGVSSKELLKWVDERTENCDSEDHHCTSPGGLRVLWGVLKIACLHYGKLRPFGGSTSLKAQGEDGPEVALGRLLAATKSQNYWNQGLCTSLNVLQSSLTEHQLQAAADRVRTSLMDGKVQEALQLAQQGQLWGIALVLAWQLGEKVYADTVLHMAQQQFSPGSPLRTLLLLFAGQTGELFKIPSTPMPAGTLGPYAPGVPNATDSAGGMLVDWLGNLSIIAANPTKGDEKVITHLGDSLWKDQGEVAGAHVCYLIAETSFEAFSKEARLCLVGADHFRYQRTFATPQAIQRTELYEYAKMLGNPQYVLVPFQPFKLLYAHMLAEAGKINESLRYCQMVIKALKSSGRGSEIEFCKQSAAALEERLRLHSQGGYNLNFSTGKLVGKVMGTIDSTIHKIIGGPPVAPAVPPSSSAFGGSQDWSASDQVKGNGSTPAKVTPLIPSASNSNLFTVNSQVDVPARSVSEPNLMWSAAQEVKNAATSSQTASVSPKQNKTGATGGGYLGRFGSQFFAKAIGLIKHSKEAKLGDENKFYYDEKLKRWVEAGAEQGTEEAVLAPPPMVASFVSGVGTPTADTKSGSELHGQAGPSASSDLPPMPPSVNQFSARGRLQGVRSRYVDTFNKGNTESAVTSSFQSPIIPSGSAWGVASTPNPSQFFTPTSVATDTNSHHTSDGNLQFLKSSADKSLPQAENELLLPKNLAMSFMDVPLASNQSTASNPDKPNNELANRRQSSAGNLDMLTNNELARNGSGAFSTPLSGNMPRAVSWSGESSSPSAVQFTPSITGTYTSQRLPNGVVADVGSSRSASATLPRPPIIEPPTSITGFEKNGVEGIIARSISSGSLQGVQYGEMQEVEL